MNLLYSLFKKGNTDMTIKGLVDLDNVVSNWRDWVFEQMKEDPTPEGLLAGNLRKMWPEMTEEEETEIVADLRGYTEAQEIPGAWRVRVLTQGLKVEVFYLSAAPVDAQEGRREWLKRNNLPTPGDLGVLELLHVGSGDAKVDWIMEHGSDYDFIVDDSLHYLDAAWNAGIPLRMIYDYS